MVLLYYIIIFYYLFILFYYLFITIICMFYYPPSEVINQQITALFPQDMIWETINVAQGVLHVNVWQFVHNLKSLLALAETPVMIWPDRSLSFCVSAYMVSGMIFFFKS